MNKNAEHAIDLLAAVHLYTENFSSPKAAELRKVTAFACAPILVHEQVSLKEAVEALKTTYTSYKSVGLSPEAQQEACLSFTGVLKDELSQLEGWDLNVKQAEDMMAALEGALQPA